MKSRSILAGIKTGLALLLIVAFIPCAGTANAQISLDNQIILDKQLTYAAKSEDLERVRTFLQKGADINARDNFGRTALMLAAMGGSMKLLGLLIQKRADLNAKDRFGSTALKRARNKEMVELLRTFGVKE